MYSKFREHKCSQFLKQIFLRVGVRKNKSHKEGVRNRGPSIWLKNKKVIYFSEVGSVKTSSYRNPAYDHFYEKQTTPWWSVWKTTIYVKISQIDGPLFRTPSLWLWFFLTSTLKSTYSWRTWCKSLFSTFSSKLGKNSSFSKAIWIFRLLCSK